MIPNNQYIKYVVFFTPFGKYKLKVCDVVDYITEYNMDNYDYIKKPSDYKKEWLKLYDDDYAIIDWLLYHSSWNEWEDKAILVDETIKINEKSFWCDIHDFEFINEKI